MAVDITVTGTTPAQNLEIAAAFAAVQSSGRPAGLTDGQWARRCVARFIKGVVTEYRRIPIISQDKVIPSQVDGEYQET